jgi:hypothetical protein
MVKTGKYMIAVALLTAACGARAQSSDELVALQRQLNELSAKIARLEQENAAKISKLESDSAVKIAKLEEADKKNALPAWVNDTKFKGDFRYRYENITSEEATNKDRQRVRLRVGAYGKVNEYVDYGVRLATGGASATSANQDIDGSTKKEIMLDQYYVDLHPQQLMGAHLLMGKMPQPWLDRTGLIWDGDLNPEGVALTYESAYTNGVNWMANAGSFVIDEMLGDDLQLWSGQLAGEAKLGGAKVRLGVSDYHFTNAEDHGAGAGITSGANTPGTGFNLVEGFGSVGFTAGLPVVLNGQYVVNTDAESDDDTAYLLGVTIGKAKNKGDWEAGYNWRDTGADAVPDGLNDSDFANGMAGSYGHSFWAKYQVAKNLQAGATYLMAVDHTGKDIDTLQLDLNFKF